VTAEQVGPPASPEPAQRTEPAQPTAETASQWSVSSLLGAVTKVGPPLTIVTALLIYFGWARADAQSKAMGVDVSMFGYSTQDYVLRSISTLYLPLLVISGLGLGWLALDRQLTELTASAEGSARLRRAGLAALLGGGVAAVAAILWAWALPGRGDLVAPLTVAGGTAVAAYGTRLTRLAPARPDRATPASPERAARAVLVGGIITLAMFWELSSYAGVVGRGYAERIARTVGSLPRVTVTSPDPLGVLAPGVTEEAVTLPGPTGAHNVRYRTTGLRLLVSSGGRVFLLTEGWRPGQGAVVVLPDDDTLRWQLSR
jgi:hypothetical protein